MAEACLTFRVLMHVLFGTVLALDDDALALIALVPVTSMVLVGLMVLPAADARLVEQIASEAGLELGGTLYSDASSSVDGAAPSYIDMMHYNLETLAATINNG